MEQRYDVVVVGGGAAGLSGALALARSRRTVLVVDAGEPRNAPAAHMHNYLGRDGTSPQDLLADGRAEVRGYGGEVVEGSVVAAVPSDEGFRVELADGTEVLARRLLVTTGLVDELPDVPGLAERWGRDVLHCPYCHGWEVRDQAIGVLGGGFDTHRALMFRQLSADVTLLLPSGATLTADEREQLAAREVVIVEGDVTGLELDGDDRLAGARLASGETVPLLALAVAPRLTARAAFLETLGLKPVELEMAGFVVGTRIPAEPGGATAVKGVWVAGNVTDLQAQVVTSAAAGLAAGAAINGDLIAEETRQAVAARAHLPSSE